MSGNTIGEPIRSNKTMCKREKAIVLTVYKKEVKETNKLEKVTIICMIGSRLMLIFSDDFIEIFLSNPNSRKYKNNQNCKS